MQKGPASGFLGHEFYMRRCIELGHVNLGVYGRPFVTLIVNNTTGEILAEAGNQGSHSRNMFGLYLPLSTRGSE